MTFQHRDTAPLAGEPPHSSARIATLVQTASASRRGCVPPCCSEPIQLGATRFEVIKNVVLPYTKSGLFAGILLSLGRALGETMAVTMVIGNTSMIPDSIFGPGNTMASVIANEFTEADHTLYLSALIELGLVLFIVTVVINMIGKRIIKRFTNE